MSKIILAIAALMLSAVLCTATFARTGDKGFYYGGPSMTPERLATLIVASLDRDSNGNAMLDPANCAGPGGCATPRHYLEAFRQVSELKGRVDLSDFPQLIAFIKNLKVVDSPLGKYEVASLRADPKGSAGYRVVMDGVPDREFERDEKAWVFEYSQEYQEKTVVTQIAVATSKCANVIYRKIQLTIQIIGGTPSPTPSIVPGGTADCPNAFTVHVNEWLWESLSAELRAEVNRLIKAAEARNSRNATDLTAYIADDVSGKLGARLRHEVKSRMAIDDAVVVNLRDPRTGAFVQSLGYFKIVNGEGDIKLTEAQYAMIIEVVFSGNDVVSPTTSGKQRRLWSRPEDRPSTCSTHVHAIRKPK